MPDQTSQDKKTQDEEGNPFDSLMDKIDSYIADPSLVNKKTLEDLKGDVEAIRSDVEGSDHDDDEDETRPALIKDSDREKQGLAIIISKVKRGDK